LGYVNEVKDFLVNTSMLKTFIFLVFTFLLSAGPDLLGQSILGISTRYNDSFREWIIATDEDDDAGEMRMRWAFYDDWTEWDISIGDISATIKQKWKEDPNLWEIRCGDATVNARTTWPGVFNRWKLNDGHSQYNWGTKFSNQRDEWLTDRPDDEFFQVYTYREGDPRDWVIVDQLPDEVSMAMKLAMIFLAVHFSSPKI
jgi:hypothetical protein